jgi:hypothetical protein
MSWRSLSIACAVALTACDIPNPGIAPASATLNFPIALALTQPDPSSHQSAFLVVANSNYDVRYNAGTLLSLDMGTIASRIAQVQADRSTCTNAEAQTDATRECQLGEARDFLVSEAWIPSFAAGLVLSPQGDRFYIPARAAANLAWVDVNPATGVLACDQAQGSLRCSDARHTPLIETGCAGRDLTMTGDPNAVTVTTLDTLTGNAADADRDVVLMVLRNAQAALFVDRRGSDAAHRIPVRTHVLTGVPSDAINAELEPNTGLTWVSTSSPVAQRATRLLARIGVAWNDVQPECSAAFLAPPVVLDALATGFDTRDVAWTHDGRFAHVLSRLPESIITIDQNGTPFFSGGASISEIHDVGFGPSRLRSVTLAEDTPDRTELLVASCFDGRAVWVMHTDPVDVATVVPGFDGAYELAIDRGRGWAFVGDFRTSVIRIIDLNPVLRGEPATLIGRIGTPRTHVGFP